MRGPFQLLVGLLILAVLGTAIRTCDTGGPPPDASELLSPEAKEAKRLAQAEEEMNRQVIPNDPAPRFWTDDEAKLYPKVTAGTEPPTVNTHGIVYHQHVGRRTILYFYRSGKWKRLIERYHPRGCDNDYENYRVSEEETANTIVRTCV